MNDIPDVIYLQVGEGDNESFNELYDVTWCVDRIDDSDIEYRRSINRYDPSTVDHPSDNESTETEQFVPSWVDDRAFLSLCRMIANRSTCIARKVGAVIVRPVDRSILSTGYNASLPGMESCIDRGYCYEGFTSCTDPGCPPSLAVHAEANAITNAAKRGIAIDGATLYVNYQPCIRCLKDSIAAGIKRIVFSDFIEESESELKARSMILSETAIEYIYFSNKSLTGMTHEINLSNGYFEVVDHKVRPDFVIFGCDLRD